MLETYADVLRKAFSDHGLQPYDATNRDGRYKVLRVKGMFSCASKHGQSNPWSLELALRVAESGPPQTQGFAALGAKVQGVQDVARTVCS